MTGALTMAAAIYVVVVAAVVATVPWWHRAATLGLRLRRLRVELVDDILTGALPPAEPVTGLVAAVEHRSERHRRLRLLELLAHAPRDRRPEGPSPRGTVSSRTTPGPQQHRRSQYRPSQWSAHRYECGQASAVTRRSASRTTAPGSTP
jgi:hypothetical protein